jgi:outer membrane protein OmpA-like peptidoglycan-associated protein
LEGAIDFQHYVCPAKYSQLQLARNLETALKKAGYTFVVPVSKNESGEYMLTVRKGEQWLGAAVLVKDMEQEVVADASALAAEIEKSGSVAVYGITFDTGKATINPQSETVLNEIVTLMKDNGEWRFEVQGHTDNVGAAAANATLSQQRAAAVVSWLTKNGVEASRLVAKGYGDTAPVADNTSDEGRAKNRRVELKKIN